MTIVIAGIHILTCVLLILIILLQSGKGADMGAAFGGSSQTIFGPTGPQSLLEKLTAGAAIVFMVTSLLLAYIAAKSPQHSIFSGAPAPAAEPAPGPTPAPGAPPGTQPQQGAPPGGPQPSPLGQPQAPPPGPQPPPLGQPQPPVQSLPGPQGAPPIPTPPQR